MIYIVVGVVVRVDYRLTLLFMLLEFHDTRSLIAQRLRRAWRILRLLELEDLVNNLGRVCVNTLEDMHLGDCLLFLLTLDGR